MDNPKAPGIKVPGVFFVPKNNVFIKGFGFLPFIFKRSQWTKEAKY
jgi:hypothetical protein